MVRAGGVARIVAAVRQDVFLKSVLSFAETRARRAADFDFRVHGFKLPRLRFDFCFLAFQPKKSEVRRQKKS